MPMLEELFIDDRIYKIKDIEWMSDFVLLEAFEAILVSEFMWGEDGTEWYLPLKKEILKRMDEDTYEAFCNILKKEEESFTRH